MESDWTKSNGASWSSWYHPLHLWSKLWCKGWTDSSSLCWSWVKTTRCCFIQMALSKQLLIEPPKETPKGKLWEKANCEKTSPFPPPPSPHDKILAYRVSDTHEGKLDTCRDTCRYYFRVFAPSAKQNDRPVRHGSQWPLLNPSLKYPCLSSPWFQG